MLIEEMEKTIQSEQQKRSEEKYLREQKEKDIDELYSMFGELNHKN